MPFTVPIPDAPGKPAGRTFIASDQPTSGGLPPMQECCVHAAGIGQPCGCTGDHTSTDTSTMRWLMWMWGRARDAKANDHARMRMIERLYRGVHYDPQPKNLEVTNFCFSNTETVAGIFNRARSMPRVQPNHPMDERQVRKIRETAHWWQSRQRVWMTRSLANRVKTKFGYTILLLTIDPATGMPYASNWLPWDWYADPSAKDLPGLEYCIFGAPIPTRRLRAMFPDKAHLIQPDSYASPSFEVTRRIDQILYYDQMGRNMTLPSITNEESTAQYRTSPQPTGSTVLTGPNDGQGGMLKGSETTFFWQFLVRDRTRQKFQAPGNVSFPSPIQGDMQAIQYPDTFHWEQPACESGWRQFFAVPNVLLRQCALDTCYGGLPFVLDYYVRHEARIEGIGEIESMVSQQRSYNEQKNIIKRSTKLAGAPVLRVDKGSGINLNRRTVDAGDTVEPTKGTLIEWLEYKGPSAQQFEHLQTEKRDMEIVTGVHEALQGIRPEGVETGVAIRELASASATRIQAKMPETLIAWAEFITKAVKVMAAKLSIPIAFKATNGEMLGVSRDDLQGEYSFSFPTDENDVEAGDKIRQEALEDLQLGIIDRIEFFERTQYPNYQAVAMRMMQMDMAKAKIEAEAKAKAGPPGGGKGGGSAEAA